MHGEQTTRASAGKFSPRGFALGSPAPMQPQDVEIERSLAAVAGARRAVPRRAGHRPRGRCHGHGGALGRGRRHGRGGRRAQGGQLRPRAVGTTLESPFPCPIHPCPSSDRSAPVRSVTARPRSASGRRAPSGSRCAPAAREHELADAGLGVREAVLPVAAGEDYVYVIDGYEVPDPCSRWQPAGLRGPSRVLDTGGVRVDGRRLRGARARRQRHLRAARRHLHRGGHVRRGDPVAARACASSGSPRSS